MDEDRRSVGDVRAFLEPLGIDVRELSNDTSTAPLAAEALGTSVGTIVKSLVFFLDDAPHLVLVAGDRKVNRRKLAQELGATKARLAALDQALAVTGYEVGGVPPVALRRALPVLMDEHLLQHPLVYAAAGSRHAVFPITPGRLRDITGARLISATE